MPKFDVFVPENLNSALDFLQNPPPDTMLISNGTDLINRIRRRQLRPKILVDLSGLSEFRYVKQEGNLVRIGALATIDDIAGSDALSAERFEAFRQVHEKFGAPNITSMATIGGNVCAASSSEDLLPVLLALDASVKLISKNGERVLKVSDFVVGKRQVHLQRSEILSEVFFPVLPENAWCAFDKIGMRNSLIIAFVNIAVYVALNRRNQSIEVARVAFNRVRGKIPERAFEAEKSLTGKRVDDAIIADGMKALSAELRLKSDFRVTGEYREHVARTVLKRVVGRCLTKLGADGF